MPPLQLSYAARRPSLLCGDLIFISMQHYGVTPAWYTAGMTLVFANCIKLANKKYLPINITLPNCQNWQIKNICQLILYCHEASCSEPNTPETSLIVSQLPRWLDTYFSNTIVTESSVASTGYLSWCVHKIILGHIYHAGDT